MDKSSIGFDEMFHWVSGFEECISFQEKASLSRLRSMWCGRNRFSPKVRKDRPYGASLNLSSVDEFESIEPTGPSRDDPRYSAFLTGHDSTPVRDA